MNDGSANDIDRPEWLPDQYDPDAPLSERIEIIADIEGGIELHVQGEKGTVEVVGSPQDIREYHKGNRLYCGYSEYGWKWEIVVPNSEKHAPRLEKANPDQDVEAYQATKKTWLRDVDVRIWGVDVDCYLNSETDQ